MLGRKTDTVQSAEFWARFDSVKGQIDHWPAWKREMAGIKAPIEPRSLAGVPRNTHGDEK
jgi:hypothetical protein